jgi:hypothetical protein
VRESGHGCARADTDVREPPLGVGGRIPHPIRVGGPILPPYRGGWVASPYYPTRVCGGLRPTLNDGNLYSILFSLFFYFLFYFQRIRRDYDCNRPIQRHTSVVLIVLFVVSEWSIENHSCVFCVWRIENG